MKTMSDVAIREDAIHEVLADNHEVLIIVAGEAVGDDDVRVFSKMANTNSKLSRLLIRILERLKQQQQAKC